MALPLTFRDLPIQWDRVSQPQADDYPIQVTRKLAADVQKYIVQGEDGAQAVTVCDVPYLEPFDPIDDASMFDGFVPVAHKTHASSANHRSAPLDHPYLEEISALLWEHWPEVWRECAGLLDVICLELEGDREGHGFGCSCGPVGYDETPKRFGGISTTINTPLGGCEGIVHELGHWKLHALGIHILKWDNVLLLNELDERFASCVRKDEPRPMGACLHALHSYLYVTELVTRYAESFQRPRDSGLCNWLAVHLNRITEGARVCDQGARFTPDGAQWWRGVMNWTIQVEVRARRILDAHAADTADG